jgi:hypothetical protein
MKYLMPGDVCRIIPTDTTKQYGGTNCTLMAPAGLCECGCGIPDWQAEMCDGKVMLVSQRVLLKIDPGQDQEFAEFWQDVKDEQTRPAGVPPEWVHAHAGE